MRVFTVSRPANCDNFITPKVNPKIWERLDHQTCGQDLKPPTLQSSTTKVGYICTKATELSLQAQRENKSPDIEQLIRMYTNALGLLGHISFKISQRQQNAIRPNLNKEYATLCASHVPITKMLFRTSCKHSSIIFKLWIRWPIPPVLKVEIRGIQSSEVLATEVCTPQVLAGIF